VLRTGATVAHSSPAFAFGLSRCACQIALYKKSKKVREKLPRKEARTSQAQKLII
jgi:hypothetical protein